MVYRQPYYFLGQQDAGLPLKGRSQSVLNWRSYSGASPHLYASSPSPKDPPSPPRLVSRSSPSRFGQTKPIWVDKKTGRVVKGPEILKGERLIRFENTSSTSSDSEFSSFQRPKYHITLEDHSPRQSPRRSKSPFRHISPSPQPRVTSYRRTSPTRATYYKYESPKRRRSLLQYSPSSDSSSSSTSSSNSTSKYFKTETSETETTTSSGYDCGALDWRQYHNAQRLSSSPHHSSRKIITVTPRRSGSPLRSPVSHQQIYGRHQTRCRHKGCHQKCERCRTLASSSEDSLLFAKNDHRCRQSVSRRSRATTRVVHEKPSSNLSFFEETILPGPNMPLKHFNPIGSSETETSSESGCSYYGPLRQFMNKPAYKRVHGRGRLNDNLEKWLNDAMKSTYSPPVGSNCDVCRGRAI